LFFCTCGLSTDGVNHRLGKIDEGTSLQLTLMFEIKDCNRSSYITLRDLIMVKQDAVFKSQKLLILHREVITGCYLKKQG